MNKQQQQQYQRIYIGGIDPDRLSVQEILDRFPTDTIVVESLDHPAKQGEAAVDQYYFHVNVSLVASGTGNSMSDSSSSSRSSGGGGCDDTTTKTNTTTTTPLEVLRKLFHNVTWKGCRLRVELARPHFLDRLAKEREEQRQQQQQSKAVTTAAATAAAAAAAALNGSFIKVCDESHEMMTAGKEDNNDGKNKDHESEMIAQSSSALTRRHLKIRNRRGIPSGIGSKIDLQQQRQQSSSSSLVVDTKPHLVTDWTDFSQKLAVMSKKHNHSNNSNNKKNSTNASTTSNKRPSRAVHLVFETKTTVTTTTKRDQAMDEDSFQTNKKSVKNKHRNPNDDDSSSSAGSSNSSETTVDDDKNVSDDDDATHDDASLLGKTQERRHDPPASTSPAGKYVWSDDDDDDHSDDDSTRDPRKRNLRVPAPPGNMTTPTAHSSSLLLDEFASAINDTDDGNDDESNELGQDGSTDNEQQQQQQPPRGAGDGEDLTRDVETNLNVLAQLFPDWTPKPVDDLNGKEPGGKENQRQQELKHSSQNKNKDSQGDTTGWGAVNTLMQRYDPTRASAQQFVIKSSIDSKNDAITNSTNDEEFCGEEPQEEDAAMDASQNEDNDNDTEMKDLQIEKEKAKDIYRQDDLEQVFREAREIFYKPTPVVVEAKNAKGTNDTGFSFAFDLGETKNQEEQSKQSSKLDSVDTFSFSFPLAADNAAAALGSSIGNSQAPTSPGGETKVDQRTHSIDDDDDNSDKQEAELRFKRRRGFSFPAQDLDAYVEGFYQLNDGKSIMDDLAGYRRDPRVKESWDRKRKALTSDWKRKRKFAQSRNKHKRTAP